MMTKLKTTFNMVGLLTSLLMSACSMQIYAQNGQTSECKYTDLQGYAENLMTGKIGALVAVVPATGEVLCNVSNPGQQMESFSCEINSYNAMGSAFNSAIVLACLQDSIITSETKLPCNHGFWKNGCRIIECHDGAANWSLDRAIATSCKGYFGGCIDMFLHSTRYKNQDAANARLRELMMSVGLGKDIASDSDKIKATPLVMANYAAIIANRGFYPASLADKGERICKALIDSVHFETVILGMRKAVESGTVFRTGNLDAEGIDLCGATGIILNTEGKSKIAFMGFAPMHNPEIAIYCVVENDDPGFVLSVPIATLVIEEYLNGQISDRRKWLEDKFVNK